MPKPPITAGGMMLTPLESRVVERVLQMGEGYVLDFSHRTLTEFFAQFDINFDDQKYLDMGTSKANKVRSFLRQERAPLVGRVLMALLDYRAATRSNGDLTDETLRQYREVAARLGGGREPQAEDRPQKPELAKLLYDFGQAPAEVSNPTPSRGTTVAKPEPVKLFISHAKADEKIAVALLEFLEASLECPEGGIRCTSVPGYGHPTGTVTSDALRAELRAAPFVVGLLTSSSVESPWVLFELGARWGLDLRASPVLHPSFDYNALPAALRGTNAVKLDNESGMVQLIDEIERDTGYKRRATARVLVAARKLVEFAKSLPAPAPRAVPAPAAVPVASAASFSPNEPTRPSSLGLEVIALSPSDVDAVNLIRRHVKEAIQSREGEETVVYSQWDRELGLPPGSAARLIEHALPPLFELWGKGNRTIMLRKVRDVPF